MKWTEKKVDFTTFAISIWYSLMMVAICGAVLACAHARAQEAMTPVAQAKPAGESKYLQTKLDQCRSALKLSMDYTATWMYNYEEEIKDHTCCGEVEAEQKHDLYLEFPEDWIYEYK